MRFVSFLRVETGRIFRSPATWLVWALSALSPLVGLYIYRPLISVSQDGYVTTTLGTFLANPLLAGGLISSILFAILTIYEADRNHRSYTEALSGAIVSPLTLALARLFALLCASVVATLTTMIAWLPYTLRVTGAVFDGGTYVIGYILLMFGSIPLSILFSAAAYQFTRRFDLSLLLFTVFAMLSLTLWSGNWLLRWVNPSVWAISDTFSNDRLFRSVAYVRLVWLLALSGLWAVSYICIRAYEKGIIKSFAVNARRWYRPSVAAVLLVSGCTAYIYQPFIDHSKELLDFQSIYYEENDEGISLACSHIDAYPDLRTGSMRATAVFQISNISGQEHMIKFETNPGYSFDSVKANGADIPFTMNSDDDMNAKTVDVLLPAEEEIELVIIYGGFPRQWNIIATMQGEPEISGKYVCLENRVLTLNPKGLTRNDDFTNVIDITLPEHMTLVNVGIEDAMLLRENDDGTIIWRIVTDNYYLIVYAGDYIAEYVEASGLNVRFLYGRKHQPIMEAAGAKDAVKYVIEYCTGHYGPLESYSNGRLKLVQKRVTGGGYALAGASTLDELDFTAQNLRNAEKGSSAADVMIHELVHQWWGLGNMFDVTDMEGPWSSEGLTVYTTYRIVKELYSEEYAKSNYIDRWQTQYDDYHKNFYIRNPQYMMALPERYRTEIANSLSAVRRYCEMPLKILKAEKLVGGEEALDSILAGLFNRELDFSYPYLTYQEFLDACGLTEEDLRLD